MMLRIDDQTYSFNLNDGVDRLILADRLEEADRLDEAAMFRRDPVACYSMTRFETATRSVYGQFELRRNGALQIWIYSPDVEAIDLSFSLACNPYGSAEAGVIWLAHHAAHWRLPYEFRAFFHFLREIVYRKKWKQKKRPAFLAATAPLLTESVRVWRAGE